MAGNLPSFARMPEYDAVRGDRMEDEEDDESVSEEDDDADEADDEYDTAGESKLHARPTTTPPMSVVDWALLLASAAMLILFVMIARKVAVAILVALVCVGVCAYSFVSAQMNTGPTRWVSMIVCVLSVVAFLYWSFRFVFYVPVNRATTGCGGVFFEHMGNDLSKARPRDEL